jgi:pilus assembly protein CpaC
MGDGQSFAVAGLLQSNANNLINQYPLLGDVPVLGALFRSTDFQRDESELVIIITSRLVKPVVAGSLRNLTDSFIPPNSLDQYLLGRLSGGPLIRRTASDKPMPESQVGLDGEYGHQIAEVF